MIFFTTPKEFEDPIIKVFGGDDKFPFHWRINLLLDLPLKDFNDGHPIYSDKWLEIAKSEISNFSEIQNKYLKFISNEINTIL